MTSVRTRHFIANLTVVDAALRQQALRGGAQQRPVSVLHVVGLNVLHGSGNLLLIRQRQQRGLRNPLKSGIVPWGDQYSGSRQCRCSHAELSLRTPSIYLQQWEGLRINVLYPNWASLKSPRCIVLDLRVHLHRRVVTRPWDHHVCTLAVKR